MLGQEKVPSFFQVLETAFSFVHQGYGLSLCQSQKPCSLLTVLGDLALLFSASFNSTQMMQVYMVSWTQR